MPWGPGPYGINTEFEIGHFEPCTRVTGRSTLTDGSFTDTFFNRCHGPYEADAPADKGSSLEPNDSPCFRRGDTHGGVADPNQVTGCDVFFGAVGDLDYDGTSSGRLADVGAPQPVPEPVPAGDRRPSRGSAFTEVQFVTDASATEAGCDFVERHRLRAAAEGPGSLLPVLDAGRVDGKCVWEFGNMRNGNTFGRDRQWGRVGPNTRGAFVSRIRPVPECG